VSSILDALEKLESRRAPGGGPEPPRRTRRGRTPLLAGAAVVAFAAGIGTTIVWLRSAAELPTPTPPAVATPAETTPSVTNPPPAEQPWAEVVTPPASRRFEEKPIPDADAAVAARGPARERGAGRVAPVPAPPAAPAAEPEAEPAPAPRAARPAGAPSVRVSFLVYSSSPARRSVALAIDETGLVTLHEGEDAGGLSVAQILPDGVELTWQGQAFTVPARN
jgi:hypothetical protein